MGHKTTPKGQILALLPSLNKADLAAVMAACNGLLGPVHGAGASQADEVFNALGAALGLANGATLRDMSPKTVKKFHQQLPILVSLLDRDFKKWNDNKVKQEAFLRLLFELLANDLRSINIKPSYTTMVMSLHRMAEVFDVAFPEYRKSGLGSLILDRHRQLRQKV